MPTLQTSSGRSFSLAERKKNVIAFAALGVGLAVAICLSLAFGSTKSSIFAAINALLQGNTASADFRILVYIRLPRVLASILAGCALAVAGVLIQAVLHNSMAAPNIIGVNSGAGLAASITIALFPTAIRALPLSAFVGALAACLLIYAISSRSGASKLTITLIGIAVGSVLNAGINAIKVLFPDSVYDADVFMIGGFSGMTFDKLFPACLIIPAGILAAMLLARDTDVLALGETTAASLGVNIRALRFVLLIIASSLAGAAVSFAGLLGFVGLLVPHIIRRLIGSRHGLLIPGSAILGRLLVLICDLFSRTTFAPYELPVGIVLSLIGGSFFILLVLSGKRGQSL